MLRLYTPPEIEYVTWLPAVTFAPTIPAPVTELVITPVSVAALVAATRYPEKDNRSQAKQKARFRKMCRRVAFFTPDSNKLYPFNVYLKDFVAVLRKLGRSIFLALPLVLLNFFITLHSQFSE